MATGPGAVVLEIEFTSGTWTDITSYVVGDAAGAIRWRGGRSTRYEEVAASTLSVPLRNHDGRFTPGNTSSPYAPNLLRGKAVRLKYDRPGWPRMDLFLGFVTRYSVAIPDGNPDDAQCVIEAADRLASMERRTMLNAMIEESRLVARVHSGGCDVFDLSATSINCDPASPAPATTFANRGLLKAGASALGSLTVQRSTVAASAQSTGLITASSAPAPPSSDEQRDRTSDGPPDELWLERLTLQPVPAATTTGGWTGPVLVYRPQASVRQVELFFRVPDAYFAPAGGPYERVLLDLWAGSTGLLRVGIGQLGGKICLRGTVASGTGWVYSDLDLADGQWRKLTLWRYAANQVVASLQDSGGAVFTMAADMDAVDYVMIGGARNSTAADGKQNRVLEGDLAGFAAQTAGGGVWHYQVLGAPTPVADTARVNELAAYSESGIAGSVYYSGSSSQDVARTPMAGRSMLDCQREVARTIGGIIFAARDGNLVLARSDAYWRSTVGTYLMLGDDDDLSVGDIVWDDGVDQAPSMVSASWPGGTAVAEAATVEAGAERDLQISTAAVSHAQALAAARALIPDAVSLCPRQISLDLVNTSTNRWGLLEWLWPDALIEIQGAPSAVLGASAWQVRIQGWDATITATGFRLTLDLDSPRAVPIASGGGGYTVSAPPNQVIIGGVTKAVSGIDVARAEDQLVIYTHGPNATTPTNEYGTEWLVTGGVLVGPVRASGSTTPITIPTGSYVLSGHGVMSTWLAGLSAGAAVSLRVSGVPTTWQPDPPSSGGGGTGGGGGGSGTATYAAPTVASSSSAAVDAGNLTVTKPSGTADGDLLVAITYADPDGSIVTPPSGWSSVGTYTAAAGRGAVYTRTAASEPSSWTFTGNSASANIAAVLRVTGTSAQVSVTPTWAASSSSSTSHAAPTVTPPHDGNVLITAVAGIFGVATSFTPPSGQTERADLQHAALWAAMEVSTETYSGTSATGTRTATSSAASLATYGTLTLSLMLTDQTSGSSGGGGTGGGGGGGTSTNRSTLPWVNGVFDNSGGTAKFDAFQAMSGRLLDMVDEHPAWVDITGSNWWYQPHVGRGYDLMVSVPMYSGSVSTNNSAMWSSIASTLVANGWSRTWWRLGVEFNLANSWQATDSNWSTWVTRFNEAAAAIKAAQPGARIVLCPNEGNGAGLISSANTVNLVDGCNWDVLAPDYYDQWPPIYNQSQGDSRFGTTSTFGTMNYWVGVVRAKGRKFGLGEWGVASGTQWAGNQGGDNPFYIDYLMSWLYANRDVVEVISYFEEPAAYLVSDITTPAHNPTARAMYQSKIAQYAGS